MVPLFITCLLCAQGNSGKTKTKEKNKAEKSEGKKDKVKNKKDKDKDEKQKDYDDHDKKIWDGAGDDNCMKPSKNQPAKVRAAFQRDYPNAVNVRWTKCRGDWTASFNGNMFRSTAVYHANGERKDTRTPVMRDKLPRRVLDEILKRNPRANIDEAIRIETPNAGRDIFRIKHILDGSPQYEYYDSEGARIDYNY